MSKILKKVHIGNPLGNFDNLEEELEEHNKIQTPEELADFYHKMLSKFEEDRPMVYRIIMLMISFSVKKDLEQIPTTL